ncbi:MAG: DUF3592 domain-containing protein [Gemmatimonadaceae bacterium]
MRLSGTPRNIVVVRALGALWLATGATLLAVGARQASEPIRTIAWPSTTGTVIDAQLLRRARPHGALFGLLGDSAATAQVRYRYTLDGVLFHSTRLSFRKMGLGSEREARAALTGYASGSEVRVYYDPSRPSNAVLEHGVSWLTVAVMVAGAVLVGVGSRWMRTRAPRVTGAALPSRA